MAGRDLIGKAKGILMQRFEVDDEAAFQMLVKSSQDTTMKLTEVAHRLTTDRHRTVRPDARARSSSLPGAGSCRSCPGAAG